MTLAKIEFLHAELVGHLDEDFVVSRCFRLLALFLSRSILINVGLPELFDALRKPSKQVASP